MKMIPGKYSGLVTCVAAAGMGMFVAVVLLDYSVVRSDWCLGAETKCFREWIGALSGWAGAAAAAITLIVLYQQIEDQRKQTAYAIGEANPDFLIERGDIDQRCNLRVVNYSRHNVVIDRIHVLEPQGIAVSGFYIDGEYYPGFQPRFLVKGNRGNQANSIDRHFTVLFYEPGITKQVDMSMREFLLQIEYRTIGQRHTKHVAEAHALARKTY
ncbi:hypothetical protein [Brucella anthropi]|uniref:hypothetical protein n=1 Tax=Brucella anthropi TaxID=529 RepID=UPI0032095ED0